MPLAHPAVRILYFAAIAEVRGVRSESIEVPDGVRTVGELGAYLETMHPELRGRLAAIRFAINESFVEARDPVRDGDVVALVPPVSGG
jgi:molybdopterin synthase sulfur carrier subunit